MKYPRLLGGAAIAAGLSLTLLSPASASIAAPGQASKIEQIRSVTAGMAKISFNNRTGRVRFLGTELAHPIPRPDGCGPDVAPETAARAFLSEYGGIFGLSHPDQTVSVTQVKTCAAKRRYVHFQQHIRGIPVFGGEMIVQLDGLGNVVSAIGEIVAPVLLNMAPTIEPGQAAAIAREKAESAYHLPPGSSRASSPELWVYNPSVISDGPDSVLLVWRTNVNTPTRPDIWTLSLVNAQGGEVVLQYNQVTNALYRKIYDANNTPNDGSLPAGTVGREEGGPPSLVPDVEEAYDIFSYVYLFYATRHGRDSIDNRGMQIISSVRYCQEGYPCPYPNAYWTSQYHQTAFGQGFCAAPDIVGHEYTHGIVSYESQLVGAGVPSAINEAFADMWGEFAELAYYPHPESERWLIGENLAVSGIPAPSRSMQDPPAYDQPDRMRSSLYRDYPMGFDDGGEHYLGGVAAKAAYLMTDGGLFNGYSIVGLGIDKVAKLFYEANCNLLISTSQYADLYNALQQAAINLEWSAGDRQQVRNACEATEMRFPPAHLFSQQFMPYSDDDNPLIQNMYWPDVYPYPAGWAFADDFQVDSPWYIESIYVPGEMVHAMSDEVPSLAEAIDIHFFIYRDAGGQPDGDFWHASGNPPVWEYHIAPSDPRVDIRGGYASSGRANLTVNFGTYLLLSPGRYWLVYVPRINCAGESHGHYPYVYIANTSNLGVAQITGNLVSGWTPLSSFSGLPAGSHDIAFTLYGHGPASPTPTAPQPTATPASASPTPPRTPTPWAFPSPSPIAPVLLTCVDSGDYDGDGTSDLAVFRCSAGLWSVRNVSRAYFGIATDAPVPGDYNGDGTTDMAIFRENAGLWSARNLTRIYLGGVGDRPVQGDYDGDGVSEAGIFRPSSGLWSIRDLTRVYLGASEDRVIPGFYNDDAAKDIAIFRGSSGMWSVKNITRFYFGASTDDLVPGDYNGADQWEGGIFRPSSGLWSIRNVTRIYLGSIGDWALPADYDGNSVDDAAIFRDSAGMWSVRNLTRVYFGSTGDVPVTR